MMNPEELEMAKQQPYYKSIVRSFLQKQIQFLLDQMSYEVGEESVIMTVNLRQGTMSHLGTPAGNAFIEDMGDVKTMFQNYCLTKFGEGMFDTPDSQVQDFLGNKRTNQFRSLPPPKRRKKTLKGKSTFTTTGLRKKQQDFTNQSDINIEKEHVLDTPPESAATETDETSRMHEGGVHKESRVTEFDLFFKNSYNPDTGDNSDKTGINDTETSQAFAETSDNRANQDASSSEYAESNNDLSSFAEDFVNKVVKIEPGTEEEEQSEQPTYNYIGSSNKYMGTDGVVVSISKAGSDGSQIKRRRCTISIAEKKEIVAYKMLNPKMTQDDIAAFFASQWGKPVARSTVSEILKAREKWLGIPEDTNLIFRHRTGKYGNMERILFQWYRDMRKMKIYVSDDMIIEKSKEIGGMLGIQNFSYSRGWVQKFKKRHSITSQSQGNISGQSFPSSSQADFNINEQRVPSENKQNVTLCGDSVSMKIESDSKQTEPVSVKIESDSKQTEPVSMTIESDSNQTEPVSVKTESDSYQIEPNDSHCLPGQNNLTLTGS